MTSTSVGPSSSAAPSPSAGPSHPVSSAGSVRRRFALTALAPVLLSSLAVPASPAAAQTVGAAAEGRPAAVAGSVPVGSAQYAAPLGALYVAPTGSDSAAGTATAP